MRAAEEVPIPYISVAFTASLKKSERNSTLEWMTGAIYCVDVVTEDSSESEDECNSKKDFFEREREILFFSCSYINM